MKYGLYLPNYGVFDLPRNGLVGMACAIYGKSPFDDDSYNVLRQRALQVPPRV